MPARNDTGRHEPAGLSGPKTITITRTDWGYASTVTAGGSPTTTAVALVHTDGGPCSSRNGGT